MIDYTKTPGVEIAVARFYGVRRYTILPNAYWGLDFRYELDLLVVSGAGYMYEIEIKVSRGDIRADKKKRWQHDSPRIRELWFAVPEKLAEYACEEVMPRAGIMSVSPKGGVTKIRKCEINKMAPKISERHRLKIGSLSNMRMWDLKYSLADYHPNLKRKGFDT